MSRQGMLDVWTQRGRRWYSTCSARLYVEWAYEQRETGGRPYHRQLAAT